MAVICRLLGKSGGALPVGGQLQLGAWRLLRVRMRLDRGRCSEEMSCGRHNGVCLLLASRVADGTAACACYVELRVDVGVFGLNIRCLGNGSRAYV